MNPLDGRMVTCTVGELLVQLRLLEYDVQAAPPLKDSGNDLIAIRGGQFRAIQVLPHFGTRPTCWPAFEAHVGRLPHLLNAEGSGAEGLLQP
jgi:hypothetical protein